ncbi:hypothetical protein DUNSADRAFT_14352 [Dunaliella salina]|uniref:Encoded protein n=1 Tax=Dunaliella salina TaxID=3046 RepID=A0ABQ7G7I9_DUNSA|nr:hypothetical protein DUNSADRAFT_14352 [Dunaliella salina]|eukprot:KAF5830567.1 hypothetical protein DUNSADRAFT_14352 [Dunaliella salina]
MRANSANEVRRAKLKEQLKERRAKGGEALAVLTQAFKEPPSLKSPFMGASSKWGKVQTVYNADMAASGRCAERSC